MIGDLLIEIDRMWPESGRRIRLSVIGSGALFLRTDYVRGTKDGDVLETTDLDEDSKRILKSLAGRGSELHLRRKVYLDIVPGALPFLPQVPTWWAMPELDTRLTNFETRALDVVDVIVSKLVPFRRTDQEDINAMVERGLVPHGRLVERFRAAVDFRLGDAREVDLPKYIEHLHIVERDMLGVDETEIELPRWI